MIIMAQHRQQQHSQPLPRRAEAGLESQQQHQHQNSPKGSANQYQEQDGKRTLIKNQLYLIEQLQLENANLRNERDQLQLENEELKFQLQMISSSNILSQPSAAFNNQQLEPLAESGAKPADGSHLAGLATPPPPTVAAPALGQLRLLGSPPRQPPLRQTKQPPQQQPQPQQLGSARQSAESGPGRSLRSANSTHFAAFSVKPVSRDLPPDDEEQRAKLLEQRYGDGEQVRAAAIVIQRAFRKHQICKRFRTITEQLRHTHQSGGATARRETGPKLVDAGAATRAAALESLSYAASRLAASANARQALSEPFVAKPTAGQQVSPQRQVARQAARQCGDPVVAAAIDFQQLESIRKRQYRVGLNIFNKTPEKGISFLVAHSFIDSSSPYSKSSSSYYHCNQLHFIDKQQPLQQPSLPAKLQSCQQCCEEDNLKRNVAHFLLHRKGLAKERIGQYLGNLQCQFNQDVLAYYLQELDFFGLQVDLALRKFLSTFRLPGEAQKIERLVDRFAQRYVQCQQQQAVAGTQSQQAPQSANGRLAADGAPPYKSAHNLILLGKDEIFILTFAIIMLNTDLHSPSLKPTSRMSAAQFVNNLRGVFKSQSINEADLIEIYERVKASQITTTPDHVTHVMKVQQGLTVTNFQRKELPNLCVPHRRLVCFCRLFEVYDVNKKERVGQHQREIFLFNDLLLVTKLARRVRANATQLYTYRQSISLQGLYVQLFQSAHYNFGIRLCQRSNDETIIMFNARNELDRSRFVDDLEESITEMDEMETIKANNIIDKIHFRHFERMRRHEMMPHSEESLQQVSSHLDDGRRPDKAVTSEANSCDTRNTTNCDTQESRGRPTSTKNDNKCAARTQAKFSSMLNLSGAVAQAKVDKLQEASRQMDKRPSGRQQAPRAGQFGGLSGEQSRPAGQRRCSTGSAHSLDSGLFLSRDVSPNQSS